MSDRLSRARTAATRCQRTLLLLAAGTGVAAAGCQVDVGGQTLPSGYYLSDDVQYYAPGPEFKLAREAAVLQAERAEEIREGNL